MRLDKKQAYQRLAVREREGEKDMVEKFNTIHILRKHFGLHGLTNEIVIIDENYCRLPDLLIKDPEPIVIELDGPWHEGWDEVTKSIKDINRDADYKRVGIKLIIVNHALTHGYQNDEVIKVLEANGLVQINHQV